MAEVAKVLGQVSLPAATLTDIYTVPSSTESIISSIIVCNRGTSEATFRIAIAIAGASDSNKQYIAYDQEVSANTNFEITTGITLGASDVIRGYASNSNISINIFGVERS